MTSGDAVRGEALARVREAIGATDRAVIVITGPAGAGKTWLARRALADLPGGRRLTGEGKFDDREGPGTLAPIMAALSALIADGLDSLYDGQTGIASLTEALGVDLDVLISAGLTVPGLAGTHGLRALDDQRRAAARITAAVSSLLRWTERFGMGRALLIDDWGRASAIGRELIAAIARTPASRPLALLLTQREPSVTDGIATLAIALGPLDRGQIATLLNARLASPEKAALILDLLGSATPDLPFDILQAADGFDRSGAFRLRHGRWALDPAATGMLAFDAPARLAGLAPGDRRIATALALWGDAAPVTALRSALDTPTLDAALARMSALGIVGARGDDVVFCHDQLRQAALEAMPPDDRAALARSMAETLPDDALGATEAAALRLRLRGGVEGACPERWRDRFARGATTARGRGDPAAAGQFAEAALSLRDRARPVDGDADRLILREAVLAAAGRDDPVLRERVAALIASARDPAERMESYETAIVATRLGDHADAAWAVACEGLRSVGIRPPPERPVVAFIVSALRWWWTRRLERSDAPVTGDTPMDAFTGVAVNAATLAYHRDPRAAAIVGFRASLIARRAARGHAFWQSVDAFLFAALGARGRAADMGERALANLAGQRTWRAMTLYQAVFFAVQWRRPLASMRDRYPEISRIALIEGDLITACYGLRIFVMSGWRTTGSLDALREEAVAARHALQGLGEASFLDEMTAMVAMLDGLTGRVPWDPALWRVDIATRNHVIDLELSNLAGDWPETLRRAAALRSVRRDYDVQPDSVVLRFHETLARLRCGLPARTADLRFVRQAARLNPADHRPKLLLLRAERQRRRQPKRRETLVAYADAVDAAARADSRLDRVLALRCAAAFAASIGERDLARRYGDAANQIASAWGIRADLGAVDPVPADTAALRDAEARAAAAMRADAAKTRLLSHVGHELRTPLQAMQALLDLTGGDDGAVAVDDIRAVLGSLTSVIDDLRIAGKLGDDEATKGAVATDLAVLLRSEIAAWRADAVISLTVEGPSVVVDIAADRVRQIARNLLSNAVKYGGGTPITVALAFTDSGSDRIEACITVRDAGPGLRAADIDRLFEPFERGAFDGDGRGEGLGLALSRRIADRLGGTLTARNARSGGACLTLCFPAPRSATAIGLADAGPARILLIEDSAFIRPLVRALLERQGHHVVEAADAARGLAAWRAAQRDPATGGRFDLAIIDIGLPDASGLSVRAAIRASEGDGSALPIILLTAATGEIDTAARDDPRVRVHRKPASAEALATSIAELLHRAPPDATARGGDDLTNLYAAARSAVVEQAELCLSSPCELAALHQLAGLAAQFGWAEMAAAVETLETALTSHVGVDRPRARIRAAIAAMA